jgi:hypothetical protein
MKMNFPMLKWALYRLCAGRTEDIRALATREWLLCPEEPATVKPAIYPKGALDRITKLSPWRTWESERRLIEGGRFSHAASRAHLLENVDISGAMVYRGAGKQRHGFGPEKLLLADIGRRQEIADAHLLSNFAGSLAFANFLLDDLPLALVPDAGASAIVLASNSYSHAEGYRDLLALPRPPLVSSARVRHLTVYTDFAQNTFKATRYRELRDRLRRTMPVPTETGRRGVYLKRGATGERRLLTNEEEVEDLLRDLRFDIVEPAMLSAAEIARRTLGARIVVGIEGSHLFHAAYTMADDGAFLVLQPPNRFAMTAKEYTDCLDMRCAFLVGRPVGPDFSVDLDELRLLLNKLL